MTEIPSQRKLDKTLIWPDKFVGQSRHDLSGKPYSDLKLVNVCQLPVPKESREHCPWLPGYGLSSSTFHCQNSIITTNVWWETQRLSARYTLLKVHLHEVFQLCCQWELHTMHPCTRTVYAPRPIYISGKIFTLTNKQKRQWTKKLLYKFIGK